MILGTEKLLSLVKKIDLVENLSARELENPEGAGFDLRMGEIYQLENGGGFLGVSQRKTPGVKLLAKFKKNKPQSIEIVPRVYYLVKTIERINLPENILALFRPRSTLFRSGLALFTGKVDPGYHGEPSFGLINLSKANFQLEMGARIVHVMFYEVKGKTKVYRGQWQGGRVGVKEKEEQV